MNSNSHSHLPFIVILDLDGTVVGNVNFQSQQYSLHLTLKKYGFKLNKQYVIPPAFNPNSKLVRPYFSSFITDLENYFNKLGRNIYFFVYTASDKSWATTEVAWIEKTHNIKLMRPLFTRDDCIKDQTGNCRKSIQKIYPKIIKAISKNYNITQKDKNYILEHQFLIIDNNAVYIDRQDKLLLCPDYNYTVFENLLHGIPMNARKHHGVQQLLMSLINQGHLCPIPNEKDDGMNSLLKQYAWLASKCKSLVSLNQTYINDDFFKYLKRLIIENNIKSFSTNIIKQLEEASWAHVKKNNHLPTNNLGLPPGMSKI